MSNRLRHSASALLAAAIALCAAPAAHAAMLATAFPQAISVASLKSALPCMEPAAGLAGPAPTGLSLAQTKSAAILGGQMSKLELMRLNQSGQAAPVAAIAAIPAPAVAPMPLKSLENNCIATDPVRTGPSFIQTKATAEGLGANDFLASKRLKISRTSFDPEWSRVQKQSLGRATVARYLGSSTSGASEATLARVNAWANQRVRFAEDRDLYGRGDYWASAASTLKRGAGDCEDIAIVKMQMLAALGVSRSDMYLTVARDLARNADHAMLVVKLGDRFWLLDNATDKLLDGAVSNDYRPIFSFSTTGKWLHGFAKY
jgi:predicted transglutaminase-like cysteine proteinase